MKTIELGKLYWIETFDKNLVLYGIQEYLK